MKHTVDPFASVLLVCTLRLVGLGSTHADDWPQWGGNDPGRNMYSPAKGLPQKFGPGKLNPDGHEIDLATTENVKWVARLGSSAFGNPTVAGGKVFIGTNNGRPRDPQHQGDRSILMCFDEQTGAFLWQLVIPKLEAGRVNDWPNLGLLSSPTVDGNRVYLVTTRCEVLCLTTERLAKGNTGPFRDEGQYIAALANPGRKPVLKTRTLCGATT
jgi:PQQ-like domain